MVIWLRGLAVTLAFVFPACIHANGLHARPPSSAAYYYYASPVTWVQPYPVAVYVPAPAYQEVPTPTPCAPTIQPLPQATPAYPLPPAVAPSAAAPPTSAPPSAAPPVLNPTPEPPLKPTAAVNDSSSFFDAYAAATQPVGQPPVDRSQIGFWNLSDRDLTLRVGGQTQVLPRGKKLNLQLGREFVWQVDNRNPQTERLPPNQPAEDIVIRR